MRPTLRSRLLSAALAAALGALSLSGAVATARADSSPDASSPSLPLDEARASARAQATGKAVAVAAATTPTESEVALPNGTFTLTQSVAPVRKYVSGAWKALDDTLVRRSDGSVGPALSTTRLTLSGGGKGPLAVMKDHGRSLSLTVPASLGPLPAPSLDGSSATYADVLAGVDLKVTADTQGGFSEVLVVKNAEAAANPALRRLNFPTKTKNVALATDAAGNITAKDATRRTVFSAPAPMMWDSAKGKTDGTVMRSAGKAAGSSVHEPGVGAHIAPVAATYTAGSIRLTPDAGLLTAPSTVYPLYIDPTYSAAGGTLTSWTWVNSAYPDVSYWKDTSATGMHVGYEGWETPYHKSRAYAKLSVDSRIFGATIIDSHFYATETYAPSCTATPVELWQTDPIDSHTTWNNKPANRSQWGTRTVAYGYSSSCPAQSLGFDVTSHMQSVADDGNLSNITLGLQAGDELDKYGWKKFDHATLSMATTYDHRPNKPSSLVTSPATTCTSAIKTVGDGDVSLYAKVADPDGDSLSSTFTVTKTSGGAQIAKPTVSAASGKNAVYVLKKSVLESAAGGSALGVSWNVTASDGTYSSPVSATCKFVFDPSRPGAPGITDASAHDCGDDDSPTTYRVGDPAGFTLAPNATGGATASYVYQLNGTTPASVARNGSSTSISVTPTRGTNVLTVTAVSSGGNVGDTTNCILIADPANTASDGDLTGDDVPDLTAVGAQAGLASGLWLAHGTGDGQLTTSATDLGADGTGANSAGSPADWNGTQTVTGHFQSGAGFNDVLDYNPATGRGAVLFGNGDGSALRPSSGDQVNVNPTVFTDGTGITGALGNRATSIASGGNLYHVVNGEPATGFPDLLMVVGGQLWDEPGNPAPGAFAGIDNALPVAGVNPTGTGDWTGWTITSALVDDVLVDGVQVDGLPALFARNTGTGALYYYTPQQLHDLVLGSAVSPLLVAGSGYSSTTVPVVQAADLNKDGTPDLRTVSANGASTARVFNASTGTLTAQTAQTLIAPSHAWPLGDGTSDAAANAADTSGGLALTGSGAGATWDTDDDVHSPNLALDGSATGAMTSNAALSVSSAFTVSAWVKPAAVGGVVASQDGVHNAGFFLYVQSNKQWAFCLATSDATRSNDCVIGGSAIIGQWTHITATYDPASKAMTLYMDDRPVARGSHTAVSGFTGKFTLGNVLANDAHGTFFRGNLSGVHVWNGAALTATQVGTMGNISLATAPYTFADVGDYNGNGTADLVAADAGGSLWLYPGNGNGGWSTAALYIGSGLKDYTYAGMGDFNSDGNADIVALAPGGTLRLFPGDAGHDLLTPVSNFPSGWTGYAFAGVSDFNRDGKPDLIARHPDGTLYMFPGTGTGASLGTAVQIGSGWNNFTFAGIADLNSDGNPDVVARDTNGDLWLYPRTATAFSTRQQIGSGWNNFTFAGIGDMNSDGNPDVVARDTNGDLWLYPRTATAFSTRQQIGHGW
ncbi:FG-GAP-like repeat-containing protein [Streptomyces longwoodensis]|uniref:FG-GAP-like repeat-containing protein n=1 Tax=Streptomyces longwoodensis TaxID=68231 RepID=UPI002E80854F|nr:FG-GAP-like repeat-containing protein [Streptomyces longwoodensis]WUC60029.1 FG-GAP-like repeat-containing protein [Streptomyces longwoodensis]